MTYLLDSCSFLLEEILSDERKKKTSPSLETTYFPLCEILFLRITLTMDDGKLSDVFTGHSLIEVEVTCGKFSFNLNQCYTDTYWKVWVYSYRQWL